MYPVRTLCGVPFQYVGEIIPDRDVTGATIEYSYTLPAGTRTNRHAAGPFCRFRVASALSEPGVYAIMADEVLCYIGEAENLAIRFGPNQYGSISARNCHHDGQSTNCKLNSRILSLAKRGQIIVLWFHPTSDHKGTEARLLDGLRPPWNGRSGSVHRTGGIRARSTRSRSTRSAS